MTPRQELLERIRKQYPTYKDAPDDWLASQIATKYPAYRDALAYEQKLPAGWIGPKPLTSLLVHEGGDRLLELEEEERQGRRGFWEALTDVSSKDLPVIGAFTDAHEMNNMAKLVRRLNKGENLTDAELVKLNLFQAYQKRVANANALGIAGGITRQSIPFMIELAASVAAVLSVADGPTADIAVIGATLGRVTGQSAAREAYEQVLKAGAKSGLRGVAQRYAARPAALRAGLEVVTKDVQSKLLQKMPGLSPSLAYAAGRVAVDLPLYSGLTMAATALNAPRTWVASPARENLIAAFKNEDIKAQDAYLHGFVNAWIENASEYSGGMLGAVLGGTLKSLPGAARAQSQARILGGVSQALLQYRFPNTKITNIGQTLRSFGVGNMFEEFAEERYADFARGLLGYEGNSAGLANAITNMIPSMEQTAGELMAFAIPGVAMGAADLALRKRDSRRSDTANAERARALLAHASNGDIAPQVGMGLRLLNTLQAEGGSPQEVEGVRAAVMAAAVAQSPEDLRGALEGIRSTLAPLPPDSLVRRRLGAIVENVPETLLTPRPDSPWSTLEALDNLGFGRDPEMPQAPPDVAQGRQPLPGVILDPARGEVVVTEGALQADQVLEPPATSQSTPAAPPATSQSTPAATPATSQSTPAAPPATSQPTPAAPPVSRPAPVVVPRSLNKASAAELTEYFAAVRERWWPAPGEISAPITEEQFRKASSFITAQAANYQNSNPKYAEGAGANVSLNFRDWASAAIYSTTAEASNNSLSLRKELRAVTGLTDSQIFSYGAWMRENLLAPMYAAANFQATKELTSEGKTRYEMVVPPLVNTPEAWTFDWRPRYEAKQREKIAAAEARERAKQGKRPAAADLRRQVNLFGEPPAAAPAAPAAPAPVAEAAPAAPAPVAEAAPAAPAPVAPAPVRRAREAIAANELYAAAVAAGGFRPTPVTGDALQTLKMQRELGAFKQIPARKRYQDYGEWEGLPGWLRSPTRDSGITMSQFYTNVADHVQNPGLVEEIQALPSWKHLYNPEYFGSAPSYQELAKTLTSDDLAALAAKQAKEEADLAELKKVARIRSSAWIMRQLPVEERAYHVDSDTWVTVKQHDTDPKSPNYRKSLVEWRDDFGLGELEWVPWYIGNLPNEFVLGRPPGPRLTLPPKVVQGGSATTIFRKNLDPAQITPKFLLEELVRELQIDPQAAEFFRDTVNRAATLVTTSSGHTRILFSPDKAIARDIIEEMFHSLRPFLPTQALVPLAKWINSRNEEAIANVTEFVPSYKWDEPGVSRDPVFATNQDGSSFTEESLFREENWRYRKIPLVVKRGDTYVVRHILVDELVAQAFMADLDDQWKSPWPGKTPEKTKTDWGLRTPKSWRRVLEETSEQLKDLLVQYPLLRSLFRAMESMLDAWARIAKQWRGENAVRGAERELLPRQGMGGLFGTVAPRDWQKSVYIAFDTILTPPRLPSKLASRGKARAARPVLAGPLAEEGSEQPNLYQPKPVEYEGVRALTITPEEYDALLETKRKQLEDVLMQMHNGNMVEEDRPIVADAIARMWGNMAVNISHLLRQPQDVRDVERQVLDIANSFMAATQSKEILVARGQMPDDAGQVVTLKKGDAGFRATQAETEVWKIVMVSRIRSMPADLLRPDSTTQASGEESEEAAQGLLVGPGLTFPSKDDLALAAAGSVTIQNFVRAVAAGKARNYLRNSRGYPRPPPTTEAARELADYTDADAMLWQQFVGDVATTVYHSTRAMLLHAFAPTAVKKFSYREMLEDGTYRTYGPEEAQEAEPADQKIARQAKVTEGGEELVGWYRALVEAIESAEQTDDDAGAAEILELQQRLLSALTEETLEDHATAINQELPLTNSSLALRKKLEGLFDESFEAYPILLPLFKRVAELRAPRPAAAATGKSGDADTLYASDNSRDTDYLAPNGKPSKLTPEQWRMVRTPRFKEWFGDWEADPANASKVLDENGEPLVVYHGTKKRFTERWQEAEQAKQELFVVKATIQDIEQAYRDLRNELHNEYVRVEDEARAVAGEEPRRPSLYSSAEVREAHDAWREAMVPFRQRRYSLDQERELLNEQRDADAQLRGLRWRAALLQRTIDAAGPTSGEVFETEGRLQATDPGYLSTGAYFTPSHDEAREYATNYGGNGYVYASFLNLRNPVIEGTEHAAFSAEFSRRLAEKRRKWSSSEWLDVQDQAMANANREAAEALGYDGHIRRTTEAGESSAFKTDEYVAFRPNQIKSADAVTRDDEGNVIPLSERFNSGNPSILYASDPLSDPDEPAPAPATPSRPVTSNFFQRYRDAFQRLLGFDPMTHQTESDQEIARLVHDIFDGPNRVQELSVQTATALQESADLLNNLALSLAGEGTIPDALPIALKAELILRAQPRLVELRLGEGNLAEAERFKEVLNRLRDEIQISGTQGGRIGRFSGLAAQAMLMGSDSIERFLKWLREQRAKKMTPEIRNVEEKAKQVISVLNAPYDTEAEAAEAEAAVKKGAEPAAVETALRDRSKPKPRDPGELARAGRDALDALMDEVMEQGHIAAQQAVAGFADGYNGKHDFFRNNRMFRSPNANVMTAADTGSEFWREFLPKINQILAKAMVLSPSEWASTRMTVAKDFLQEVSPEDADSLEAQMVALHMLDVALLSFWRSTSTRLRLLFGDAPKEPQLRPGGTPAAPAAVTEISVEQAQRQLNATYLQVRARLGDNATNEDIDAYHETVRAIVNGQIEGMSPELIEAGRRIARRLHLPHLPPRQLNDVQVLARQLQKILQDRIPGDVPKPPQTSPFDLIRLMFSEAGSEKMNQVAQAALAELMAKYGLTRDQIELAEVFGAGDGLREDVRRKLLVLNQVFELAGVSLSALDKISPFKGAPVGFLSKLIARAVSEEIRLMPEFQHIATQGPIAQRMAVEELRHRMMQRLGLSGASAEIIADQVSRAGMEHIRKAKIARLRQVTGKEFTDEYLDDDFLMRVGRHVFSGALKPTRLRLRYAEFLNSMVEGPWTADLVNFYDQLRNPLLAPANSQELVAKWVKESKDWPGGEQELQRAIGTLESLTAIVRSFDHEISEQRSMRLDDWLSRRFNLPNITQYLRDTLQRYGDAWDRMMYEDLQYRKEFLRAVGEEGPALPSNEGMLYREDYQILAQATQEALMRTAGISKLDIASSTFYMHLLSSLSAQEINFISTAVQALETTGLMAVVSAHRLAKDKPLAERFGIFSRIMGEAWRGTLDGFRVNWTETWRTGRPRGPASLVAQQTGKGAPRLFESGIVEDFPVFFQKWIRFWRHGTRALAGTDLSFKRGAMQASLVRDIERAIRDGKINEQQAAIYRSLFVWGGQYDLRTPLGQQQVLDDISRLAPEDGYRKLLNGQFHLLRLAHARAKKEGYDPASNAYRLRVEELVFVQRDMPLNYLAQGEAIATGLSDKGILDFLQAEYIGGRATFNIHPDDPIFAGTFLTDAKEMINKLRDLHPVMNFLVPFTSVVTAVLQSRINSTPFGFYRARKLSAANRYGLHETSEDDIAQLKLQAAIGVGLSVSLLALAMAAMVGDPDDPLFEITGRGPSDPRLRNQLRARGWKEHTVKIGALRLGYLDSPMALNLAFLGAFLDSARYDKQSHSSLIARTAFASLELVPTFVDQTYLSSASRLLEAATGASPELRERAFLRWGTGLASGLLIPSAVKQLNRFFDPTLYQANDLMGLVLRETPIMQARMLLGLDPALNAFGEPIKMGTPSALLGIVRAPLDNPVSLGRIGVLALNPDPLWSYLVRHNLVVPTVGRAIMIGGVELTDEQLYKYTRVRGRLLKTKLEQALEATSWAPMSQEALDKLAAQASREAKLAITAGPATVGAAAVATPEMLYSRW